MADINLVVADQVNVVSVHNRQHTAPAGEDITAGAPCYIKGTDGKFYNSDANAAGANVAGYGNATMTVKAGQPVTCIRNGVMDGYDLSGMNPGETVYISDTVGRLADAPGTANLKAGFVLAVFGTNLGVAPDKVLQVEFGIGDV